MGAWTRIPKVRDKNRSCWRVDVALFADAKMAVLFTTVLIVALLVGLALWLGSELALNKYRCERPDNDDVMRPTGRITSAICYSYGADNNSAVRRPIVFKVSTLYNAGAFMGLIIKPLTNGASSGRPQVAVHRNCPIFSSQGYFNFCYFVGFSLWYVRPLSPQVVKLFEPYCVLCGSYTLLASRTI